MKRILALVLLLCTAASCVFVLNSCGCKHEKLGEYGFDDNEHWRVCNDCDEKVNVTAHDFGTAERISTGTHKKTCKVCNKPVYVYSTTETTETSFETVDLGDNYVVDVEIRASQGDERQMGSIAREGSVFCQEFINWKGNKRTHEAMFAEFTESGSFQYEAELDSSDNVTSCVKTELNEGTLAEFTAMFQGAIIPADLLDFSLYTYDEEDQVYEANSRIGMYKNIKLGYEDGKLATVQYVISMPRMESGISYEVDYTYKMSINYGAADITIPAVTE